MIKRILNQWKKMIIRLKSPKKRAIYMKKYMNYVGNNVKLFTTDFGTEPYLIHIEDNVVCASNVRFITHDISCFNINYYLNENVNLDKVGPIVLKNNCFIGAYSILMPNCSVGVNSIIAAGSVVTKKIPDNEVWGGNPAHFIMTVEDYSKKLKNINESFPWITNYDKNCVGKELINKRKMYFFGSKEED